MADWEARTLEGKLHSLKAYRGQIVILDFWYWGCGWCIWAMPQIKGLVADFQGQPVVVLGIKTTRTWPMPSPSSRGRLELCDSQSQTGFAKEVRRAGLSNSGDDRPAGKCPRFASRLLATLRQDVGDIVRQMLGSVTDPDATKRGATKRAPLFESLRRPKPAKHSHLATLGTRGKRAFCRPWRGFGDFFVGRLS